MQEAQIIGDFLIPTNQQTPGAVGPGMRSFDNPAAGLAIPMLSWRRIAALPRDVSEIAALLGSPTHRFGVVSFIGAQVLPFARRRAWAANGDVLQRLLDQLLVMHIGAGNGDANRDARRVG